MTDAPEPPLITAPPGVHGSWSGAYEAARVPAPKAHEMIDALKHMLVYGHGNASATAAVNGGVYDPETMRRLAALEAAKGVLERIADKWTDLPEWVRDIVLGRPKKKRGDSGDNRAT